MTSQVFDIKTNQEWEQIGFIDGLVVKNFDKQEAINILCDNYRYISEYVRNTPDIDYESSFLYLPIFRRIYQSMIERLASHKRRDEIPLLFYTEYLCDWRYIIEQVDNNFHQINKSLYNLYVDSQAETCLLISQSICNRNNDLICNNFDLIVRDIKISKIVES